MILTKLQEALAEVIAQRANLEHIEMQLRAMIAMLPNEGEMRTPVVLSESGGDATTQDKIDAVVNIVRAEGKPLHITMIAERLSEVLGRKVLRTEIEPGLNRHIAKTKRRRLEKFGPSIFGLPEWKVNRQPVLVESA